MTVPVVVAVAVRVGGNNLAAEQAADGIALFLAFARLVRGPSLPDRVVALDLIGVITVGVIAAYDILTEQPVLLDAATGGCPGGVPGDRGLRPVRREKEAG